MYFEETPTSQGNILVVDDTHANLHFLNQLLTSHQYTVRPVPEGTLAISSAQSVPPDLILLDIMLPDISGYDICYALKQDERTRDIPVIFISVKDEVWDKVKAFSLGAVDYITKPFQAEEVLARVKTHLDVRRLQKTLETQNIHLQQEILERKQAQEHTSQANQELQETLQTLQKTQQYLVDSEKMAELGQLVASIAHELSTPLATVRSSTDHLSQLLPSIFPEFAQFFFSLSQQQQTDFFALCQQEDQGNAIVTTKEKRQRRKTLRAMLEGHSIDHAPKIAEIFITMGIYERIDRFLPLLQTPDNLSILLMASKISGLRRSASALSVAVDNAIKIIRSLKSYARYDRFEQRVEADILEGIDTVLTLYHAKLKHGIDVRVSYEDLPRILCYPDELMQVWTNLIQNALHALQDGGALTITAARKQEEIVVTVTDTGHGIPAELTQKIFEPFFTTKPGGEGNGLGLDIVKKIIAKHQGKITVDSRPGETTFVVTLPIIA